VLLKILPGTAVFLMLYKVFRFVQDWIEFVTKVTDNSVAAYRKVLELSGRVTAVRVAITMLALFGLALWVLGVRAMTRLAVFLLDQLQRHGSGLPKLSVHSLLSGLSYQAYAAFTGYAVPAAVAAIVLLLVLTHNRLARSLAGLLMFGIGALAAGATVSAGILTVVYLVGDLFTNGIHLFDQGDGLGWNLIVTAVFVLYLWSFFAIWELVPRLRRLWIPDPPAGSDGPRGALGMWLEAQGIIDYHRR
jgi:hypothetical protein